MTLTPNSRRDALKENATVVQKVGEMLTIQQALNKITKLQDGAV